MSVSVVMAAYNGEKYLPQQIDSIISQMNQDDELIISLDPSNDRSEQIIRDYCMKYSNIRLLMGPGKGLISNFENGLRSAVNEYIFLADQDDVWLKEKISKVVSSFDQDTMVVMHDATITDSDLNSSGKSVYQVRNLSLIHI